MYKIRISCTNENELSFNYNKINRETYNEINIKLSPYNINYINAIIILYKTNSNNFTTKTLEFKCIEKINENQFIKFIQKMKDIGFYSEKSCPIQFVDYTGNIIFNYDFNTIYKYSENIKHYKKKNKSYYKQLYLYKYHY